ITMGCPRLKVAFPRGGAYAQASRGGRKDRRLAPRTSSRGTSHQVLEATAAAAATVAAAATPAAAATIAAAATPAAAAATERVTRGAVLREAVTAVDGAAFRRLEG